VADADVHEADEPASRLRRALGLPGAVVVGVGAMLGTGVFAVWTPAYALAGSGLVVSLLIAVIIAALNATSTARLAADIPLAGGAYAYSQAVLGRTAGNLAGYAFVLGKSASAGAAALTIGAYLWPAGQRWLALLAIVVVLGLDLRGITRSTRVTAVMIAMVLVILLGLVIGYWAWLGGPTNASAPRDSTLASAGPWGVIAGAGIMFVAFAGYARVTVLGEEVRQPRRTIPRAVAISFAIVLIVYAAVGAMVVSARARLGDLGDAALDTIARSTMGESWAVAVTIGAVVAAGAVLLSLIAGIGRTLFAMGSGGDAPRALAAVANTTAVPYRAEIMAAVLAAIVVLIGGLSAALAVSGASILTYYAVAHAAAWRRWPRPGVRIIAGFGLLGCVGIAVTLVMLSVAPVG
jgi:basic amino acid/polyamine antiporter, APA family